MAEEVIKVIDGDPPEVTWNLYRGDTFISPVVKFVDDNGNPLDISGYSFEFEVRFSPFQNSGTPAISNANTEFITGQSDEADAAGIAKDQGFVKIEKEHTNIPKGKWYSDLRTIDGSGDRDTPLKVRMKTTEDVSNPTE